MHEMSFSISFGTNRSEKLFKAYYGYPKPHNNFNIGFAKINFKAAVALKRYVDSN